MTKLRPLQDRIVVKRVAEKEKTSGGIIIPDVAKEKPVEGTVVGIGPGRHERDRVVEVRGVKAGDRVLFGNYAGTEVKVEGEEFVILREDDLLGVLETA